MLCSGKEARIGLVFVHCADIDERRRVRQPNKARKLCNGDFCGGGHGGVRLSIEDMDAIFQPRPHGVIAVDPLPANPHHERRNVNFLFACNFTVEDAAS